MRKVCACFVFGHPYDGRFGNAHLMPGWTYAHWKISFGFLHHGISVTCIDEDVTYEEIVKQLVGFGYLLPPYDPRLRYNLVLEVFEQDMPIPDPRTGIIRRVDTPPRSISNAVPLKEGQTLASTHLTHLVSDFLGRFIPVRNVLYCACSIEIRDSPPPEVKPSSAPSWDKIINAFLTSLAANAINFTASVVTITVALIAIEKSWSKKPSTDSASSQKNSSKPSETDIIAIHLRMTHGPDHEFEEWLTDPDRLKQYIDVFNQPSSSIQPLQAIFVQRIGKAIKVDVSKGTQNNLPLSEVLSYLHIDLAQQ
jgi:hypothetical protein